jgi:hypothetical protein
MRHSPAHDDSGSREEHQMTGTEVRAEDVDAGQTKQRLIWCLWGQLERRCTEVKAAATTSCCCWVRALLMELLWSVRW